jgi:uncharacterized protein (TIGR01777 family)
VRVIGSSGSIKSGNEVAIKLPVIGKIGIQWVLRHTEYDPPNLFRDEQIRGPFKSWRHNHKFISESSSSTKIIDNIEYKLPLGGDILAPLINRELTRLFRHRHRTLTRDMELHSRWNDKPRKTVLIAGASGFVGNALSAFLSTAGHTVLRLVRRTPTKPNELFWDPASGVLDPAVFNGVDVVINLCGENIASGRWTPRRKELLESSRVYPINLLARVAADLKTPPEVFINASGAGFYGNTGLQVVDENSGPGDDFLARIGLAWEEALGPLRGSACRVAQLRIGMVLNGAGGALAKTLPAFICGLGGKIGSGGQYISWIALSDLLGIFEHVIFQVDLSGPINAVAPNSVTNTEFTKALGKVLTRPTIIPVPAALLRIALGELSQLLLASNRISPSKLIESGYLFTLPKIEEALRNEIG